LAARAARVQWVMVWFEWLGMVNFLQDASIG
jgi:hypothetical protein